MVRSSEPDARLLPSGEKVTDQTASACAWTFSSMTPDAASQTVISPFLKPAAIVVPSGDTATAIVSAPGSSWINRRSATLQTLTGPFFEALTSRAPSGDHA